MKPILHGTEGYNEYNNWNLICEERTNLELKEMFREVMRNKISLRLMNMKQAIKNNMKMSQIETVKS